MATVSDNELQTIRDQLRIAKQELETAYLQLNSGLVQNQPRFANGSLANSIARIGLIDILLEPKT